MRGASNNIGGLSNPLTRTLVLIKSPVRVCRTVTGRNKKVQSLLVRRPDVVGWLDVWIDEMGS
jgi:hypothetical protein